MKTRWKIAIVFILLLAAGGKWFANEVLTTSTFLNAAYTGQTDVVTNMLKSGADINVKDPNFGSTALIYAAQQGHIDLVRLLLDNHADINATTRLGQTALSQAAFNQHADIVKLLLERGAALDDKLRPGIVKDLAAYPDVLKMLPAETPHDKAP